MIEEKFGKKKKQKQLVKAGNMDLRKYPHLLADGSIIGVRIDKENVDKNDDFQTDADLIAKAEFVEHKRLKEKEKAAIDAANKKSKKAGDEHSLHIDFD